MASRGFHHDMQNKTYLKLQSNIAKPVDLPDTICFRVTRYCNARCGFCLAPPDGSNPAADKLTQRLEWLLGRGVKTIHFCGGEPTIHPALPRLIEYVDARGGKTKLTTNGIAVSNALLQVLRCKVALPRKDSSLYPVHWLYFEAPWSRSNPFRQIADDRWTW